MLPDILQAEDSPTTKNYAAGNANGTKRGNPASRACEDEL